MKGSMIFFIALVVWSVCCITVLPVKTVTYRTNNT